MLTADRDQALPERQANTKQAQQEQPEDAPAEDARDLPPDVQGALGPDHQDRKARPEQAPDHRRHAQTPQARPVAHLRVDVAFVEIHEQDGRGAIQGRVDRAHRRRRHRRQDQSLQARRKLRRDEVRKGLVALADRCAGRAGRVEREQRRPDVQEDRGHRDVDQHADPDGTPGLALGRHGRVLLHEVLVGQEISQVLRHAVDDHHPDGPRRQGQVPTAEAELVGVQGRLDQGLGAREDSPRQAHRAEQQPADHDDRLHDVGPDHGLHAAQQRVEDRNNSDDDDNHLDRPIQELVQQQSHEIQDHRGSTHDVKQE